MDKQELIEVLKVEGNEYHPEHGIRAGLEKAVEMIDELLDDELEPLVVPKHIGDWLDKQRLGYDPYLFSTILELNDMWVEAGCDDFINYNKKQLIEVIFGKREYKVDKQKLYYIKVSDNQYAQWLDEENGDLMLVNHEAFAGRFTEDDINKINPYLAMLAVEVQECPSRN